jgi:hypothetical protein
LGTPPTFRYTTTFTASFGNDSIVRHTTTFTTRCKIDVHHNICKTTNDKVMSDNGIKQGYPLSPTMFGFFIDELDEVVFFFYIKGSPKSK